MTVNPVLQCSRLVLVVGTFIFAAPLPAGAAADDEQPSATSFEELATILERGQEVVVTDEDGRSVRGRVSSISSNQLVLVRKQFRFSRPESRDFAGNSIATIHRVDSTRNGGLIGAATAAGLLAALIEHECSPSCDDNFGRGGRWVIKGALFVPIGLSLGRWIDSSINQPIYQRPSSTRVAIAPLIQRGRKGLVAQVSF